MDRLEAARALEEARLVKQEAQKEAEGMVRLAEMEANKRAADLVERKRKGSKRWGPATNPFQEPLITHEPH